MKIENRTLNLLKLIGCFLVVFIHVTTRGTLYKMLYKIIAWPAPIFLMISGYYIYNKDSNKTLKKIPFKIKKTLKILIICMLIFSYLKIYDYVIMNNNSLLQLITEFFSFKNIIRMLLFNCFDIIYSSHLWYLLSLALCYTLLRHMLKNKKIENRIRILIPIFLCIRIIVRKYTIDGLYWYLSQNFILSAFPYFFLGYFISEKKDFYISVNSKYYFIALLTGIILSYLDLVSPIFFEEVGICIISISLFLLAIKYPNAKIHIPNISYYTCMVYLIHPLSEWWLEYKFAKIMLKDSIIFKPIAVFAVSIIIAFVFKLVYSNIKKYYESIKENKMEILLSIIIIIPFLSSIYNALILDNFLVCYVPTALMVTYLIYYLSNKKVDNIYVLIIFLIALLFFIDNLTLNIPVLKFSRNIILIASYFGFYLFGKNIIIENKNIVNFAVVIANIIAIILIFNNVFNINFSVILSRNYLLYNSMFPDFSHLDIYILLFIVLSMFMFFNSEKYRYLYLISFSILTFAFILIAEFSVFLIYILINIIIFGYMIIKENQIKYSIIIFLTFVLICVICTKNVISKNYISTCVDYKFSEELNVDGKNGFIYYDDFYSKNVVEEKNELSNAFSCIYNTLAYNVRSLKYNKNINLIKNISNFLIKNCIIYLVCIIALLLIAITKKLSIKSEICLFLILTYLLTLLVKSDIFYLNNYIFILIGIFFRNLKE